MNDTMLKEILAAFIVGLYCLGLALNWVMNPALQAIAIGAIGYLFKPGANGGWTLTNPLKKAVPVVLLCFGLIFGTSTAKADILNPVPHSPTTKAFLASVNGFDSASVLSDVSQIINYLGVREGEAYNFNQHKWVTTTGATVITYTPLNLALGVTMLNTDGFGADLDWNLGAYLPSQNVPVMNLTKYLYVFGGVGAEQQTASDGSTPFKLASYAGVEFKFEFGPTGT